MTIAQLEQPSTTKLTVTAVGTLHVKLKQHLLQHFLKATAPDQAPFQDVTDGQTQITLVAFMIV